MEEFDCARIPATDFSPLESCTRLTDLTLTLSALLTLLLLGKLFQIQITFFDQALDQLVY